MPPKSENLEVWFVTGAQLLYGGETVKIVDGHSKDMVDGAYKGKNSKYYC